VPDERAPGQSRPRIAADAGYTGNVFGAPGKFPREPSIRGAGWWVPAPGGERAPGTCRYRAMPARSLCIAAAAFASFTESRDSMTRRSQFTAGSPPRLLGLPR
jgi:hypothetical protein